MRVWKRNRQPAGRFLTRAVYGISAGIFALLFVTHVLGITIRSDGTAWASGESEMHDRALVLKQMEQRPGKQLVLVHYSPQHNVHREWVFNSANIDQSKVVWAHDMGPSENRELLDYFKGREVWLVEPDRTPIVIEPYSSASARNAVVSGTKTRYEPAAEDQSSSAPATISRSVHRRQSDRLQ